MAEDASSGREVDAPHALLTEGLDVLPRANPFLRGTNLGSVGVKLLCPRCREVVDTKLTRIPALDGTVILEYYCSKCGSLLRIDRKPARLPQRRVEGGFYVAIEGIDGVGKTAVAERLVEELRKRGYDVVLVKEPYVKAIKEYLYKHDVDPDAEAYLFAADRIILQTEVVVPALRQGKIVVSDRSLYASIAYQGARGLPREFVEALNKSFRPPDLVILLDAPVEVALERAKGPRTKFRDPELLGRARKLFLELAESERGRFVVVDATKPLEEVVKEALEAVLERVPSPSR